MYIKLVAVPWYGFMALSGIAAAQAPLAYDSAYAAYRPFVEEPAASWREVNDETARIGGHAGIFGGSMHHGHGGQKPAAPPAVEKPAAKSGPTPAHRGAHH